MASNSYTFIIVPDAKSQCKRVTISMTTFYLIGIIGVVAIVAAGIMLNTMLHSYKAVSARVRQVEKLKKTSISHKHSIDRFETEITQLSNNLSHIKHLNSRLMVLAGLDPERGEQNLGLGGLEEESSQSETQDE
jgi:hypothetical protein